MNLTRRTALSAGLVSTALPRFARAQDNDRRPAMRVAVQKISNTLTLDPLREQSSNASERWMASILENLIGRNQQGGLERVPALATAWRRIDDLTLEFDLRQGVIMHDGREFTSEDVLQSFGEGRIFGPSVPKDITAIAQRHFPTLDRLQPTGRYGIRFITSKPDVTLEGRLSAGGGEIISAQSWRHRQTWQSTSIGTGPYRVAEFHPGNRLVLEAHDAYWGGRPPVRWVVFLEVPEAASRIAGLRSGDFHFACDLMPDQAIALIADPKVQVQGGMVPNHRILAFDKTHPPLDNPKVRLAMAHAVDGQAIVDSLWAGKSRVPPGLQFEFYGPMFVPRWRVPEYNPPLARTMLLSAGYNGEEIIYRARHNYYPAEVSTAQILLEYWRQVGLNVKLEICENWAQVLTKHGPRGVRDWSNSATFDDPVSSLVAQHGPNGAQQSNGEWSNAEMNALCTQMEASTDIASRQAMFRRMLQICEREDPAYIVLHQNAVFTAHRKGIPWKASPSFFLDFSVRGFSA
ncbi:MAG: ABC transporter substrate-binding protein [Acetobacteraceae bacterium]|nr:ABC transporter substrate-binding protein [Acetobacteraceae bacterium]